MTVSIGMPSSSPSPSSSSPSSPTSTSAAALPTTLADRVLSVQPRASARDTLESLLVPDERVEQLAGKSADLKRFYEEQNDFVVQLQSTLMLDEGDDAVSSDATATAGRVAGSDLELEPLKSARIGSSPVPATGPHDDINGDASSAMPASTTAASIRSKVSADGEEKASGAALAAIQLSLGLTFALLGMKAWVAVSSGSMAVVASAVDSMLDVLSQGTLLVTHRVMSKNDPHGYPTGKRRLEPLSVLIFAVIMGLAALQLLVQSIQDLVKGLEDGGVNVELTPLSVAILLVVLITQFVMFLYCRRVAQTGCPGATSAEALAQDHINDVCINLIGGIPAVLATYSVWWLDPIGAIALSIYIFVRWSITCYEQFPFMIGKAAELSFLRTLTFIAATHDERVLKVDTVLAYHVGTNYQCEVHVALPSDLPLHVAHDIGESLERKIERLENVDVAFVHLDFETSHRPEHARARGLKSV